ncbi:MAG TPA: sulfatase-like hydrolase/transferase [Anaerolineales bacterium]|nr:sulfatase-like hydrolase/transferase [Anaerolineales bacterium]
MSRPKMQNRFNRRDFLKLAASLPLGLAVSRMLRPLATQTSLQEQPRNVIVVVCDAFSAYDISLYGYARQTTPNIDRLAKRALVYHNHFSAGNFTSPGTASLLTGVLPWTHRAININGKVIDPYITRNIFSPFREYYRIAYTHNAFANTLLTQFQRDLDELIPRQSLFLESYDTLISTLFENDEDIASISWIRSMQVNEDGSAYSLFLSHLYETLQERKLKNLKPLFPRGLPTLGQVNPYLLETAVDGVAKRLAEIPQPFLGYFHFMPPHHPYRTSREFFNAFKGDGFESPEKPVDILARRVIEQQPQRRTEYDEFILYCDKHFDRFYQHLESSGLLEDTWLVLTSDHGEMFERGISGHGSSVLYQPVVRIPLLIFEPGRQTAMNIYEYTSAVDVLPTLAHLTGQAAPDWTEGTVLPPYAGADPTRNVYVVQAIDNAKHSPLTQASTALVRENYKIHYYFGYPELPEGERVSLFDIKSDPEELVDLYPSHKGIAAELLNELKSQLAQADRPYL